jgi:8-oxo-dGTP pyrophosphatase MutT (NUDIX family)
MTSACVYIECPITKMILAVARKDNPNEFGLPGGKVEDGEMEEWAAARELREETGIIYRPSMLMEIFRREGGVTFKAALVHVDRFDKPGVNEPPCRWVSPERLIAGPFGEYNYKLLKAIGRIK